MNGLIRITANRAAHGFVFLRICLAIQSGNSTFLLKDIVTSQWYESGGLSFVRMHFIKYNLQLIHHLCKNYFIIMYNENFLKIKHCSLYTYYCIGKWDELNNALSLRFPFGFVEELSFSSLLYLTNFHIVDQPKYLDLYRLSSGFRRPSTE